MRVFKDPNAPKNSDELGLDDGPDQLVEHRVTYAPRLVESNPTGFRFARYPDGKMKLQGGYKWTEGYKFGVVWKDIPMVDVDEDGQEIETT